MNTWLAISLGAYLLGATIEGIGAASQLSHSIAAPVKGSKDPVSSAESSANWQVVLAITIVSICGALFWPCRLLHRSFKQEDCQNCQKK